MRKQQAHFMEKQQHHDDQYYFNGLGNRDEKVIREIYKKFLG